MFDKFKRNKAINTIKGALNKIQEHHYEHIVRKAKNDAPQITARDTPIVVKEPMPVFLKFLIIFTIIFFVTFLIAIYFAC